MIDTPLDIVERLEAMLLSGDNPKFRTLRNADLAEAAAEIRRRREDYHILKNDYDAQRAEIERLKADIEEILRLWRKGTMTQIGEVARRALEPKP